MTPKIIPFQEFPNTPALPRQTRGTFTRADDTREDIPMNQTRTRTAPPPAHIPTRALRTSGQHDQAVSDYIDSFWKENYGSPSFREIMAACGIPSLSVTRYVVLRVARARGDWVAENGKARGIVPKWARDAITKAKVRT